MNLSGILVLASPERCDDVVYALNQTPGVEVCIREPQGRIIAVQETASVDDEVAGLRLIKELPHVISAELVYHYLDDENSTPEAAVVHNTSQRNESSEVPAYLNN